MSLIKVKSGLKCGYFFCHFLLHQVSAPKASPKKEIVTVKISEAGLEYRRARIYYIVGVQSFVAVFWKYVYPGYTLGKNWVKLYMC